MIAWWRSALDERKGWRGWYRLGRVSCDLIDVLARVE